MEDYGATVVVSLGWLDIDSGLVVWETGQVRDGSEVLELVGIDDATHRLDNAVKDVEAENADDLALRVMSDEPRPAVDEYRLDGYPQSGRLFEQTEDEGGHLVPSVEGLADGGRLAASIAVEDGVRGEEVHQLVEIAVAGSGKKGPKQGLALFGR